MECCSLDCLVICRRVLGVDCRRDVAAARGRCIDANGGYSASSCWMSRIMASSSLEATMEFEGVDKLLVLVMVLVRDHTDNVK